MIAATALVGLLAACGDDEEVVEEPNDTLAEEADPTDEDVDEPEEPTDEATEPDEDADEDENDNDDSEPDGNEEIHEVQSGETLSSIAAEYDVTVDELVEANDIEDPDVLEVEQELIIP